MSGLFERQQIALVTGASRGIGRAIAVDLAREGATVIVNYRADESAAKETANEIESCGGVAHLMQADVADEAQVRSLFRSVRTEFGRLDLLVNNAGIKDDGFLMMMSADKWHRVLQTNVDSVFLCSRDALKLMARPKRGAIVNVASVSGLLGPDGQANYAASKGAIIAFTKTLAREAAPHGVRANVVAPGFIDTDMVRSVPAEALEMFTLGIPLRRIGRPQEVAHVASFLLSERAAYVTGSVLTVDGGLAPQ